KVARTGIEPMRELLAAKEASEAHACIYIAIGEVSDNARRFAAQQRIQLVGGPELALLLPRIHRGVRATA
ncbi:MAG: restriction endonuclease, partial [Casimicrobiaceae bacterium]